MCNSVVSGTVDSGQKGKKNTSIERILSEDHASISIHKFQITNHKFQITFSLICKG